MSRSDLAPQKTYLGLLLERKGLLGSKVKDLETAESRVSGNKPGVQWSTHYTEFLRLEQKGCVSGNPSRPALVTAAAVGVWMMMGEQQVECT